MKSYEEALKNNFVPSRRRMKSPAGSRPAVGGLCQTSGQLGVIGNGLRTDRCSDGAGTITLSPRAVLVLCADNGVVAQGVTQTDSSVTGMVAQNLARNRTSVCRMAAVAGCRVVPVDMGMLDFAPTEGVLDRRIGNGTGDISLGPAMSREQAAKAVLTGIELVKGQKELGMRLLATGEMGIAIPPHPAPLPVCCFTAR